MANKKKKCKYCKEYFDADTMVKVPAGTFCTMEHTLLFVRQAQEKTRRKQHTAEKKKFYGNHRPTQLKLAQDAFNAYIRERDKGQPCISCNRSTGAKMNAGHYRSVGAARHLRFNQFNVNIQCEHCNSWKSGNAVEYRINLVKKFGVEKVEEIESTNDPMKWSIEEITAIKEYYRKLKKTLTQRRKADE